MEYTIHIWNSSYLHFPLAILSYYEYTDAECGDFELDASGIKWGIPLLKLSGKLLKR